VVALVGLIVLLLQVGPGSPIIQPPANVTVQQTNVFPPPDPAVVVETEKKAAPAILDSGLRAIDGDGGKSLGEVFKLGLAFGQIRKDMILLPVVQDINHGMQRIVLATLGLVIAALALWGLIGQFLGSDAYEAFEMLAHVPLWCILAVTSLQWFGFALDLFAALAGVISTAASGAFGPTFREDFWSNAGLGLFALFVGLFYLLNLLLFSLQLFANTAFLAFCALVAPVFVFLKATPWTSHWGGNWFRMAPATAGDLLAMLSLLVVGAAGLDRITGSTAFATIGLDLGLLLTLPLIRRLFALENNSVGSHIFGAVMLARLYRNLRSHGSSSTAAGAATGMAGAVVASSPTQPTRAPRWAHAYGSAATPKPRGVSGKA